MQLMIVEIHGELDIIQTVKLFGQVIFLGNIAIVLDQDLSFLDTFTDKSIGKIVFRKNLRKAFKQIEQSQLRPQ